MIHITENVYIGDKDIKVYINSCLFALGKSDTITIVSRGNNIKRAVDVAAIIIRQYIDNPTYEVVIGSEGFEDRNVSTIEIVIKGTKKDGDK